MKFGREAWERYRAPIVLLLIAAFCAIAFHHILLPFLVAIFIAYLIDPVVSWFHDHSHLPRWVAVILVYLVGVVLVTGFIVRLTPQLVHEARGLTDDISSFVQNIPDDLAANIYWDMKHTVLGIQPGEAPVEAAQTGVENAVQNAVKTAAEQATLIRASLPNVSEKARLTEGFTQLHIDQKAVAQKQLFRLHQEQNGDWSVIGPGDALQITPNQDGSYTLGTAQGHDQGASGTSGFDLKRMIEDALDNLGQTLSHGVSQVIPWLQKLFGKIKDTMLYILVTLMVAAFLSIDIERIQRFFRSLFRPEDQDAYGELVRELNRGLRGVIRGQLLICLINGLVMWAGLAILHVKFAFALGVLAGVLSIIPVFGAILSGIPCVLVGLAESPTTALLVVALISVVHLVEGNILSPNIIGSKADIHPALIIFALLAGEQVYGIIGAVIAVPVASIVQTIYLFYVQERWKTPAAEMEDDPRNDPDPLI